MVGAHGGRLRKKLRLQVHRPSGELSVTRFADAPNSRPSTRPVAPGRMRATSLIDSYTPEQAAQDLATLLG